MLPTVAEISHMPAVAKASKFGKYVKAEWFTTCPIDLVRVASIITSNDTNSNNSPNLYSNSYEIKRVPQTKFLGVT